MSGEITRRGLLLVLLLASAAGKTTITRLLIERDPELAISVSVTTRAARAGEVTASTTVSSTRQISSAWSPRASCSSMPPSSAIATERRAPPSRRRWRGGRDIISDIDCRERSSSRKRAQRPRRGLRAAASMTALEERLRTRAQDSAETVRERLAKSTDG